MKRVAYLIISFFIIYTSCVNNNPQTITIPYADLCTKFLNSVNKGEYDAALSAMDDILLDSTYKKKVEDGLMQLSQEIKKEYGEPISMTPITYEKTIHENSPSIFIVIEVKSKTKFGYYFFIVREQSKKIILVSEFGRSRDKRE